MWLEHVRFAEAVVGSDGRTVPFLAFGQNLEKQPGAGFVKNRTGGARRQFPPMARPAPDETEPPAGQRKAPASRLQLPALAERRLRYPVTGPVGLCDGQGSWRFTWRSVGW